MTNEEIIVQLEQLKIQIQNGWKIYSDSIGNEYGWESGYQDGISVMTDYSEVCIDDLIDTLK